MCDLLWSDPIDDDLCMNFEYKENESRQCAYKFGLNPLKRILDEHDFTLLIRAHQV